MKNNIIYLHKLHVASNDIEHLSYCDKKCDDKNSIFMFEISDRNDICPECLNIINSLTCDDCSNNYNGCCDAMCLSVHEGQSACYMHMKK